MMFLADVSHPCYSRKFRLINRNDIFLYNENIVFHIAFARFGRTSYYQ